MRGSVRAQSRGSCENLAAAVVALCLVLLPASVWAQDVTMLGTPIARVEAPLGLGARSLEVLRDNDWPPLGTTDAKRQYDTWDGANTAAEDWLGYTFSSAQVLARVSFQEGLHFYDGGWFTTLTVQVRQGGIWNAVTTTIAPPYPGTNNGTGYEIYTLTFPATVADGVRIYGAPGGSAAFVSAAELRVYGPAPEPSATADPVQTATPIVVATPTPEMSMPTWTPAPGETVHPCRFRARYLMPSDGTEVRCYVDGAAETCVPGACPPDACRDLVLSGYTGQPYRFTLRAYDPVTQLESTDSNAIVAACGALPSSTPTVTVTPTPIPTATRTASPTVTVTPTPIPTVLPLRMISIEVAWPPGCTGVQLIPGQPLRWLPEGCA